MLVMSSFKQSTRLLMQRIKLLRNKRLLTEKRKLESYSMNVKVPREQQLLPFTMMMNSTTKNEIGSFS